MNNYISKLYNTVLSQFSYWSKKDASPYHMVILLYYQLEWIEKQEKLYNYINNKIQELQED